MHIDRSTWTPLQIAWADNAAAHGAAEEARLELEDAFHNLELVETDGIDWDPAAAQEAARWRAHVTHREQVKDERDQRAAEAQEAYRRLYEQTTGRMAP